MHHTVRQRAGDKFSCLWNFCTCHSLRPIFTTLTPVRRAVLTWVSYPALWRRDEVRVKDEQLWHCQDRSQVKFFVLLKVTFFWHRNWENTLMQHAEKDQKVIICSHKYDSNRETQSSKGKYFQVETQAFRDSLWHWVWPNGRVQKWLQGVPHGKRH